MYEENSSMFPGFGDSQQSPLVERPVRGMLDMGAYELLWLEKGATFARIAERFRASPLSLPSDLVSRAEAEEAAREVLGRFTAAGVHSFGVRINGTGDYPTKLREAVHPVELLYYRGDWDLASSPSVAIVGTREASDPGRSRARKLARLLVEHDITVVSGLARGIDTEAHTAAIEAGGRTIAVIGTPIHECYPPENSRLQDQISAQHLLVSQVPVLRYAQQDYRRNRAFFPERNKTMSALTAATVIVEAGETSGTLIQAQAALAQNRKLFVLDSCFENPALTWPARYERLGAVRVRDFEQILEELALPFESC
jgi:DNA processing protein